MEMVFVRLPPEMLAELDDICEREEVTRSAALREAVAWWVADNR